MTRQTSEISRNALLILVKFTMDRFLKSFRKQGGLNNCTIYRSDATADFRSIVLPGRLAKHKIIKCHDSWQSCYGC